MDRVLFSPGDSMMYARSLCVASLAVALTIAAGCRLTQTKDSATLDGAELGDALDPTQDTRSVPVSMWSPAQRESTAGFYFLAAEMMSLRGQLEKALPVYEASYNLDPNAHVGGKMIAAKASVGDKEEALAEAHRMVLLYPRNHRMRFLYAEMLAGARRPDEAIEQLETVIKLGTENDGPYLLLSALLFHIRNDRERSIRVLRDLTVRNPASVAGLTQLAKLLLATGRKSEAIAPARRAWEIDAQTPEVALVYAIALEVNSRSKDAMQLYEQLYRTNPTNEELTARMVQIYRELGDLGDALELLDDAARAAGKPTPGLSMQRAIVLWELRRYPEADKILQDLLEQNPDSDRVIYMNGRGRERSSNFDDALALYARVPKESPLRPNADIRRAVILQEQKKFSEAAAVIRPLTEGDEPSADAFVLLAGILSDDGKPKESLTIIAGAVERLPGNNRLLFLRGVYEEKTGDITACIRSMREVIRKEPRNSSALNFLGYIFAERGENLEEAESLIGRALEVKPNDGYYLDSLAWVFYQRGDYEKAWEFLERAAKVEPEEGVIFEHKGDVKLKLGDENAALDFFEKAASSKLEERDRKRLTPKLERLRKKLGREAPPNTPAANPPGTPP